MPAWTVEVLVATKGKANNDCYIIKRVTTLDISLSYVIDASRNCEIELDSHTHTSVVGDNILVINDHDKLKILYHYDPKDVNKIAIMVDVTVGYVDSYTGHH